MTRPMGLSGGLFGPGASADDKPFQTGVADTYRTANEKGWARRPIPFFVTVDFDCAAVAFYASAAWAAARRAMGTRKGEQET